MLSIHSHILQVDAGFNQVNNGHLPFQNNMLLCKTYKLFKINYWKAVKEIYTQKKYLYMTDKQSTSLKLKQTTLTNVAY